MYTQTPVVTWKGCGVAFPLIGVMLAVGISLLRGGRFHHAANNRLFWLPALILGLGLQTVLDLLAARGLVGLAGTVALLLMAEAASWRSAFATGSGAGMALIAIGFSLNVLVILANGGMPVSPEAIAFLGGDPSTAVIAGKHHLMTADTILPWLGDVIPIPRPASIIISIGDIVLVAGMIPFAHDLMTPDRTAERLARRQVRQAGSPTVGS
jgi:hypothetical protein